MGVNTIKTMLSRMKKKSSLAELCVNKKITNHFARKTTVRKLRSFGFPKCDIKNITDHSSERGLDAYDSGNGDEMFAMSSAISKSKYSTSTVAQKIIKLSPSPKQSKLDFSRTLHPTLVNNNSFSFGINWNNFSRSQLSKPLDTCLPGFFSFNRCQVNININNIMQPQQNNNAKRKRHIIYSDSEESQD